MRPRNPLSPRRLGPSILYSLSNFHEMFATRLGVFSRPEMGHTAGMAPIDSHTSGAPREIAGGIGYSHALARSRC